MNTIVFFAFVIVNIIGFFLVYAIVVEAHEKIPQCNDENVLWYDRIPEFIPHERHIILFYHMCEGDNP